MKLTYRIISVQNPTEWPSFSELARQVDAALADGFKPVGGPIVVKGYIAQAIMKEEAE